MVNYPSVSVVRPVRGLEHATELNLQALLGIRYPGGLETIFVFEAETDPALPLLRRLLREFHDEWIHGERERPPWARVVFSGAAPGHRSRELHAMLAGIEAADGELVAFSDRNTRPKRSILTELVETLFTFKDAGCAFATVVVRESPRTIVDACYALWLNGVCGPACTDENPPLMGHMLVLKRDALDALAEPEDLAANLARAGYRHLPAPVRLPLIARRQRPAALVRLFARSSTAWSTAVSFWIGLVVAGLAAVLGPWWAFAPAALVPIAVTAGMHRKHRAFGGAPLRAQHLWVGFALLVASPLLFALALLHRRRARRAARADAADRIATLPPPPVHNDDHAPESIQPA